jgi:hypothetical protein
MNKQPEISAKWEDYRRKFRPNTPQEVFIAFENFLFFIGTKHLRKSNVIY